MRELRSSTQATSTGPSQQVDSGNCTIQDPRSLSTLGECLTQRIAENAHTLQDAAIELGTIPLKVRWWANDTYVPDPEDFGGLTSYLDIDVDVLKGLILRSQMHQVQRRLRGNCA